MRRYESFIEVEAPVEVVFDMLADFEAYPRWMSVVREVRRTGRRTSRWLAETALDMDVEWEAETTVFEPDRRIVWRAFRGDVHADGETILSETERGTTLVRYILGYDTPAGRTGRGAAQFFGGHPGRRLERDLEEFKRFAESFGRGVRPGRRRDAPDESRAGFRGRAARRPPFDGEGVVARERHRDSERRARDYDEPQREARREEDLERMRRAPVARGRDRRAEYSDEGGRDDGSGWLARRGVDRLLENPPSGRWRR